MTATLSEEKLQEGRWVTLVEACAELKMSERQVRRWGVQGKILLGKDAKGRTLVDLSTVPDADEATLLEAAVSLAREQRKSCVELFTLYQTGLRQLHGAFHQENQQLREERLRLEKQLRLAHKTVEELGDGAVARELAIEEHQRAERRWDVGVTALMSVVAQKLNLDEKMLAMAIEGLLPPIQGDAPAPESDTTPEEPTPDATVPDADP